MSGANNASKLQRYHFDDAKAFAKTNQATLYYRLRQVDFDGKSSYSNTAVVFDHGFVPFSVIAAPNPFEHSINIELQQPENDRLSIQIINIQGQVVWKQENDVLKGGNTIAIDNLDVLKAGMYTLKIAGTSQHTVLKMIKY